MKKINYYLSALLAVLVIGFGSCDSDDPIITIVEGINVADGFYVTLDGEDPLATAQLKAEIVEDDGFGVKSREGYMANVVFLSAGNYRLLEITDKEIANTFGGSAAVRDALDDDGAPSNAQSGCGFNDYILVDVTLDGAVFNVATAGVYKVAYDETTSELVLFPFSSMQIIGDATVNGWSDLASEGIMTAQGTPTAAGATFKITETTLRPGSWKIRFGCRWKVDRRIDFLGDHADENGYVMQLNIGGTLDLIEVGGANFAIETGGDGKYTITATWDPITGISVTQEKVSSIDPIAFLASEHEWAVVGGATTLGWPANNDCGVEDLDIDMNFEGESGGTFTWVVTLDLAADGFKFRANNCWDENRGINDITNTGDIGDITASDDGNYVLGVAGNFTITLTTSDEGATYSANFLKN